jgi:hypothetical protein
MELPVRLCDSCQFLTVKEPTLASIWLLWVGGSKVVSQYVANLWKKDIYPSFRSWDNIVCVATSYRLDNQGVGVRAPVGIRIISSPRCPDRLWGPPNLVSNGYQRLIPRGWSGGGLKLTTHLKLVPRSGKCWSIHPLPHTPSWNSA